MDDRERVYTGYRGHNGAVVLVDGRLLPLRLDLANHSPTGFEWGYGGSGPAQLALALIADATGNDEEAITWHQDLKWAVVQSLPDRWTLTRSQIREILNDIKGRHLFDRA
jgi:hypothetical protein